VNNTVIKLRYVFKNGVGESMTISYT